jgi:hypothetical protein
MVDGFAVSLHGFCVLDLDSECFVLAVEVESNGVVPVVSLKIYFLLLNH